MHGKSIYWEASVFLSWLKNEPRAPGISEGMEQHVRLIDEGKIKLVTSVVSFSEVLEGGLDKSLDRFHLLFNNPNVVPISMDTVVAKLAGEIRTEYRKQEKNITTPDAIHLASALHYGVAEFHTLDTQLLSLGNNVAGRKLLICEPYSPELSLLIDHIPEQQQTDEENKE